MKPKAAIERRRLRFDLAEIRVIDGANGPAIRGYAAKFNADSEDLGGFKEFIAPGCFTASIAECDVRCLVDHNPTLILGRNKAGTLTLSEDEIGLVFECNLPDTQAGRDIAVSIKRGDVSGCSFGFIAVAEAWHNVDGEIRRELIRAHLFDVGPVTFPAYPDTDVAMRSLDAYRCKCRHETPPATPLRDAANLWLRIHGLG